MPVSVKNWKGIGMANPNPSEETRFKPGNCANPKGRPTESRDKLTTGFIDALLVAFEEHGEAAIQDIAENHKLEFLKMVAQLTPKAINVKGDHTVAHIEEALSVTEAWIEEILAKESGSEPKKPKKTLPN